MQKKHFQHLPNPCWIDVSQSISDSRGSKDEKSRDQGIGPGIELAGCPDKLFSVAVFQRFKVAIPRGFSVFKETLSQLR
jgi:hypothetical protein